MKRAGFLFLAFASAFFALASTASAQLTFNLTSTGNADADAGFQAAADFWSSQFDDNIEVNLTLGFAALGTGVLAQAGSTQQNYSYSDFRDAVQADSTSLADASYAGALPTGNAFSVYINRTTEGFAARLDNDGGANNTTVNLTNANAKALGLIAGNQAGQDATITFSSQFNFDFDQTDGINAGQLDFVGVAIHEIGHALGFISGVDVLDGNGGGNFNDDQFTFVSALDLTRHSAASIAAGADLDFTADARAKFYSIDGGATAGGGLVGGLDHFSLGQTFGDGQQASHFRDNNLGDGVQLGILDPVAVGAGNLNVVSALDIQAFDVIGFNLITAVPEPSSALVLTLLGGLFLRRRRS